MNLLAACAVLTTLIATSTVAERAYAWVRMPASPGLVAPDTLVSPAAMCGNSCRRGGRYIPGPPSVCEQNGLVYCGPSGRGRDAGPAIEVPGMGVRIEGLGRRRHRDEDGWGGGNCRTVTVERDDGTVRRTRRCD
jgi:hypothetical protein